MSHILVIYATVDGQTGRVAQQMARVLRHRGFQVTVRPASVPHAADDAALFEGVIVGGGIRFGHYPKYLGPVVRHCIAPLATPTAFYSVSLTGGGPGAHPKTARGYVDKFLRATAWKPAQVQVFGGALLYTRYNLFIKYVIRMIVGIAGGDTDMSRDYEYTDWAAVDRFAFDFGEAVAAARQPLRAIA